jgi:branched-subunit amino acid ABC-type transport system permease component
MLVILLGGIDLSVPWIVTVGGVMSAAAAGWWGQTGEWLAIPFGIACGALLGLVNGVGVAWLRVPSMIFTLGINAVAQGLIVVQTGGFAPQDRATRAMHAIATGRALLGVPNALLVWLALGAATLFLLHRTSFGRAIYAVGNSERAAYLSGIATRRVVVLCFVLAGACSATAGVLLTGYSTKAYQAMGDPYLLPAIAAVVLGGTHILGGRGLLPGDRRRRAARHAAAVHPVGDADPRDGPTDHLRRRDPRNAARLRARPPPRRLKEDRVDIALTDSFEILDARFRKLAFPNVHLERLHTGCRWCEGPAWFAAGRYLVWSDIPNDRMLRWDETDGSVSVFRQPSMNSNGHFVDLQGRLVSCEHRGRCVSRTEHDGSRTVLAAAIDGKRFNSPNDVVVKSDGLHLVHRPELRHRQRLRGRCVAERDRRPARVPPRPARRQPAGRRRRLRAAERPGVLARRVAAVRRRHRRHPPGRRAASRAALHGRCARAVSATARYSPPARRASTTDCASTRRATCGCPRATACTAIRATARCWERSACPRSSPTYASAAPS